MNHELPLMRPGLVIRRRLVGLRDLLFPPTRRRVLHRPELPDAA
jgi:hypothetical protein